MSTRLQPTVAYSFPRFGAPETAQLVVIAREFESIARRGADLHLVVVEMPNLAHPWRDRMPPLGLIRPDLAGKPPIPRPLDLIPTLPVGRFLLFGDARLVDRFTRLALQATAILRRLMPSLEDRARKAGPDEPFWRANLWPSILLHIFENADPTERLYEVETHERPEWGGASLHSFTHDIFESSALGLMSLVMIYGADEIVTSSPVPRTRAKPAPTERFNRPRAASVDLGSKTRGQPRDQGKGAKCKAAFIEACQQKETPPTPTELAERFGCSPATASRAVKPLEDKRKAIAKGDRGSWEDESGRRHDGSVA